MAGDRSEPDVEAIPLVTVVIPAYTYENYVGETIQSVLDQTYPEIETLVVDDGSTDGTAEVVKGFGGRVSYIHKENGGLGSARNRGISDARGEFLVFLDADDLLEPDAVDLMVAKLQSLTSDYALVACQFTAIDGEGKEVSVQERAPADGEVTYKSLLLRNRFCPVVLVRRSVICELGMFDTEFGVGEQGSEDRDMWIRIAAGHRIFMLGQRLVRKRQHTVNMSSNTERQMASMRRTLGKAKASGVVSRWNLPFWGHVSSVYHMQGAMMFKEGGDKGGAWRELLKSFVCCPWPCSHREAGLPPLFRLRCLTRWSFSGFSKQK